ncbi:hypothetical protein FQR65_LT08693 [Abscondita terminalis]|nr:hypothetical protein FQR65_LT08693 [Abscondita terminalis]
MNVVSASLVLVVLPICESARILAILPTPSYSHQIAFHPLWKELSLRGHQVTLITTDPIDDHNLVNLTQIDLKFSYDTFKKYRNDILYASFPKSIYIAFSLLIKVCDPQLAHPDVQALIKNPNERFDVVIVQGGRWPFVVFAERFRCPLITISTMRFPNAVYNILGNPLHSTVYPDFMVIGNPSLWGRVYSVVYDLVMNYYWRTTLMSLSQGIADKHFGTNYSKVADIIKNNSMTFINRDTVFYENMPLLPNFINIGGMPQRLSSEALPKDLQATLDNAVEGFVYFSLGTNVKSKELSERNLNVILETFAELPYLVLWKYEEDMENKPRNVITRKWLPQASVLSHRNIKVFVTQGGVQSLDEAKYNNVPTVGMPFFGDQIYNVLRMVERGMGLSVDFRNLNKNIFKSTILEVIQNPIYKKNVETLSRLVLDQPMSGLDQAVWWTEFVIRHKGAEHLRSPFLEVSDYQYYYLDVFFVLCVTLLGIFAIVLFFIKCLVKTICRRMLKLKNE